VNLSIRDLETLPLGQLVGQTLVVYTANTLPTDILLFDNTSPRQDLRRRCPLTNGESLDIGSIDPSCDSIYIRWPSQFGWWIKRELFIRALKEANIRLLENVICEND